MWVDRDKDGELYLYSLKPIKGDNHFICNTFNSECMQLESELLPEITWENSPKEIVINLI